MSVIFGLPKKAFALVERLRLFGLKRRYIFARPLRRLVNKVKLVTIIAPTSMLVFDVVVEKLLDLLSQRFVHLHEFGELLFVQNPLAGVPAADRCAGSSALVVDIDLNLPLLELFDEG